MKLASSRKNAMKHVEFGNAGLDKKPYHHGDLRAQLIRSAVDVIREHGVEALSLRALARQLGVSHAAPARHFASKDALLNAIIAEGSKTLVAAVSGAFSQPDLTPRQRLKAFAMSYLQWVLENPAQSSVMRSPEVTRFVDRAVLDRLNGLMALLERAVADAQAEGWRSGEERQVIVNEIALTIIGAVTVLNEPVYGTVRAHLANPTLFEKIIDSILADGRSGTKTAARGRAPQPVQE